MIVRQDFCESTLPPKFFLIQILDTLPRVYLFLWEHKNAENQVRMTWKELHSYFNKNAFRSSMRRLLAEGLISYKETKTGFSVEVVGWDDFQE